MLFFRAIILTLAFISVVYSIYYLRTHGIDRTYFYVDEAATPTFDPKIVKRVVWKSKSKEFTFDRTLEGSFFPEDRNKQVQDLLRFLSQIRHDEVQQTVPPALIVELEMPDGPWLGHWDGMSFIWKTGPFAGKGEILKQEKNQVFFKGKYVFDIIDIDLCHNRISKIQIDLDGKTHSIIQSGRGWKITTPYEKEIDAIFIEKWLVGLCDVQKKTLIDLDYTQSDKSIGFVAFDFIDGKRFSFQQIEKDFYTYENRGVVLTGLDRLKTELKSALHNYRP